MADISENLYGTQRPYRLILDLVVLLTVNSVHDLIYFLEKYRFKHYVDELQNKKNRSKSSVRAKVDRLFRILKRVFGFDKVRYRGLAKNHHRLCANFALGNLYMHRKRLAVLE